MKILHICSSLKIGGLERDVVELIRSAPGQGDSADVAVMSAGGALEADARRHGARVFHLHKLEGLDPRLVPRLRSLARGGGYGVVHAHNQGAMLYAGLAALVGGPPVVGTRHGASRAAAAWRAEPRYRLLSRIVGRLCRYTVCVGADSLRVAREVDHLPAGRLRLIYNGVDTDIFRPDPEARRHTRAELGLGAETPVLISVARLSHEKDPLMALEALARCPGEAVLVWVGGGEMGPAVQQRALDLGLAGRVRLLGPREDVPRLLAGADVFLNSSLSEGISLSILEGMAAGLPVAATAVGGTTEIITSGEEGLLCPAADPEALARCIADLLAEPRRAAAMGLAARQRVLEKFGLTSMARGYARLYREAAEGREGY